MANRTGRLFKKGDIRLGNIQIGNGNVTKGSTISNDGITQINGEVWINGNKIPKCPGTGMSSTIINDKIYIDGYEWTGKCWKRTLKALWYKMF